MDNEFQWFKCSTMLAVEKFYLPPLRFRTNRFRMQNGKSMRNPTKSMSTRDSHCCTKFTVSIHETDGRNIVWKAISKKPHIACSGWCLYQSVGIACFWGRLWKTNCSWNMWKSAVSSQSNKSLLALSTICIYISTRNCTKPEWNTHWLRNAFLNCYTTWLPIFSWLLCRLNCGILMWEKSTGGGMLQDLGNVILQPMKKNVNSIEMEFSAVEGWSH